MVGVMLCFGPIFITHFFNVCKEVAKIYGTYTYIYDIQLHFQNNMQANNNWMAGCIWPASRSLDTPAIVSSISCV